MPDEMSAKPPLEPPFGLPRSPKLPCCRHCPPHHLRVGFSEHLPCKECEPGPRALRDGCVTDTPIQPFPCGDCGGDHDMSDHFTYLASEARQSRLTSSERDALGAALLACIPAISGFEPGSTAEAATADQAADEWLMPAVETILRARDRSPR